jgi:choline monooxygenase
VRCADAAWDWIQDRRRRGMRADEGERRAIAECRGMASGQSDRVDAVRVVGGASMSAEFDRALAQESCLPATTYTEPGVLARELEHCYANGWVSVGLGRQLSQPGSVRPVEVAGRRLLLVRDRDEQIRVFHNVCRHRGVELVDRDTVCQSGVLACPYHDWSYGLDGVLRAAPYWDGTPKSQPDAATRAQLGLLPVRSAVWNDIVFVDLSGTARPFPEFIAPLAERWKHYDFSRLQFVDTIEYRVPSNWKFVCENFLDYYHVPWVHRQLGGPELAYQLELTELNDDIYGFIMLEFDRARADAPDPPPVFPNLPPRFEYALDLVYVFPNTLLLITPGFFQAILIQPDGPAQTRELLAGYVVSDTAPPPGGVEFMELLKQVNDQDVEILTRLQRGRAGPASDRGRYAPHWDVLCDRFARRVAAAHSG